MGSLPGQTNCCSIAGRSWRTTPGISASTLRTSLKSGTGCGRSSRLPNGVFLNGLTCRSDRLDSGHHALVFVIEDVAMENGAAGEVIECHPDSREQMSSVPSPAGPPRPMAGSPIMGLMLPRFTGAAVSVAYASRVFTSSSTRLPGARTTSVTSSGSGK